MKNEQLRIEKTLCNFTIGDGSPVPFFVKLKHRMISPCV